MNTISMRGVSFNYAKHKPTVLEGIDLDIGTGVYGLLGPNGAGKTTLIKILAGITAPSTGEMVVGDAQLSTTSARSNWRAKVGYLPQHAEWFAGYTVQDFVQYFAMLRGVKRSQRSEFVAEALEAVKLTPQHNTKLSELSGGQRQRALIAQALVHRPDVLILDEPTASLDPVQRVELKRLISELGDSRTIIVSTHLIEDLVQCAREIMILNHGRFVWQGSPTQLTERGAAKRAQDLATSGSDAEVGMLDILIEGKGNQRA